LQDVGLLLDKWTLDSKANLEDFHPEFHLREQPKMPQKDVSEDKLYWKQSFLAKTEPVKPLWLDDRTDIETTNNYYNKKWNEQL
jgi:hypothetical protein